MAVATYSIFDRDLAALPERHGVTRDSFHAEVRPAAEPVILRGLVANWPAVTAAQNGGIADYLSARASDAPTPTILAPSSTGGRYFYNADMSGFNFERRNIPVRRTLEKLTELDGATDPIGIYAGATSTNNSVPGFAADNPMPVLGTDVEPLIWVGNSARIAPHFDTHENIACSVAGARTFVLFPADQVDNLYIGPLDRTMAGPPASLVDPRAVDAGRFPRFEQAVSAARVAVLQPGDAIYMPPLWWHYVESTGPLNVLVNYWWNDAGDDDVMASLALVMLLLRERPVAERRAWATLFDHYVFGENAADVAAHIPEAARSILGTKTPARDAYMKRYLRGQLGRTLDN